MKTLPISDKLKAFARYVQERAVSNDTFKVPRFVVGPSAYNFMLWHLCETFDAKGGTRQELESFIEACKPWDGAVAKECLVVVAGPGQNNRPFTSKHFLDTAVRTHLVLSSKGRLTTAVQTIDYEAGDVFTISPQEIEQTSSKLEAHSVQVVVYWTTADAGPVWQAYAKGTNGLQ